MAVIMAFTEPQDAPEIGIPTGLQIDTTASRVRSANSRLGFRFDTADTVHPITPDSGLSEGWFSVCIGFPTSIDTLQVTNTDIFTLRLNTSVSLLSLRVTNAGNTTHTYAWRNHVTGTDEAAVTTTGLGVVKVDIWFKIHATTGFIRIFYNNVQVYSYSGNTVISGGSTVNGFQVRRNTTGTSLRQMMYSELLFSDQSTVGSRVVTRPLNALGSVAQWTGAASDINDTSTVDTTFMSEATAGEVTTFTSAALGALAGGEFVSALILQFRANQEASSPVTRIEPLVRLSGINYVSTAILLTTTVTPYKQKWETNPATSNPWTIAEINAAEPGFRAAA